MEGRSKKFVQMGWNGIHHWGLVKSLFCLLLVTLGGKGGEKEKKEQSDSESMR